MRFIATMPIAVCLLILGCAGEAEPPATSTRVEAPQPTIALIGATSRTGREIIRQALAAGYPIKALARTPSKLGVEHENLTLIKGDVRDLASLEAALDGHEVVVSMVGFGTPADPTGEIGEVDIYTVSAKNLIAAMHSQGNQRLIIASSTGVEHRVALDSEPPPATELTASWRWNARRLYNDMAIMEEIVAASSLDHIILRPGFLVEEPARGDLKIDTTSTTPPARVITYADFAAFVIANLTASDHLGQALGLYSDTIVNPAAELEKVMKKPAS
jgi:putative NADH-flavin reductase